MQTSQVDKNCTLSICHIHIHTARYVVYSRANICIHKSNNTSHTTSARTPSIQQRHLPDSILLSLLRWRLKWLRFGFVFFLCLCASTRMVSFQSILHAESFAPTMPPSHHRWSSEPSPQSQSKRRVSHKIQIPYRFPRNHHSSCTKKTTSPKSA